MSAPAIKYDDLTKTMSTKVIVDVRNPGEVIEHGQIPGSHCIPLPEIQDAFQMDAAAFKLKYGLDQPTSETLLVTHCMKGGRAQKAADALLGQGYTNVLCYVGSFNDWVAKGGAITKPGKPHTE